MERFAIIVRNTKLSPDEKAELWLKVTDDIIKTGKKKGYLVLLETKIRKKKSYS